MPVYEYFCPQCSRELEILRPIQSAGEQPDCPSCRGKAWKLVSSFGSKTGTYLQPSGAPFRVEPGWPVSRADSVLTATRSESLGMPPVDDQQALSPSDMSWLLEWQPNGSNLWFIRDWGISSVLRYLREYVDVTPVEEAPCPEDVTAAEPADDSPGVSPGADQQLERSSAEPWADQPPVTPEPGAGPVNEPMAASRTPWFDNQATETRIVTEPNTQTSSRTGRALAQHWLPASYYGRLMLMAACIATVVVTAIWILATAT